MRTYKLFSAALFALFCSISSMASADVVVYSQNAQHKLYLSGGTTIHLSHPKGMSVQAVSPGEINNSLGKKIIVVNKLATYWVKPGYGNARIRITVPMQFYLTSWDVKALERELERLGVKVKPKPLAKPGPKPGPLVSG